MTRKPLVHVMFTDHEGYYNEIELIRVYGDTYRIFESDLHGSSTNHIIALDEEDNYSTQYVFECMNADWNKVKDFLCNNDEWIIDDSSDF